MEGTVTGMSVLMMVVNPDSPNSQLRADSDHLYTFVPTMPGTETHLGKFLSKCLH